jgi:hypothetical protein
MADRPDELCLRTAQTVKDAQGNAWQRDTNAIEINQQKDLTELSLWK